MARPKTGKLVARGPNTWRLFWELGPDPQTGKRRQKTETFHGTKEAARKYWRKVQAEIDAGRVGAEPEQTVAEYLQWWETTVLPTRQVRPTTRVSYHQLIQDYVVPALGTVPVTRLDPAAVQRALGHWLTQPRRDGRPGVLSPTTVQRIVAILREALNDAVRTGVIDRNPCLQVPLPKAADFQPTVWDADAVRRFLAVAAEHRWGVGFRLGLLAGLRRGEILGLRWEDIDWTQGVLTIRRALVHVRGQGDVLGPVKTARGYRQVALDADTVAWLRARQQRAEAEAAAAGALYRDHGHVLQTGTGTPVGTRNFDRTFDRLCRQAGVPRIRLHDLRHTHGTALYAAGVDLKTISDRLGHSQIRVTADLYVRPQLTRQTDAVARLTQQWGLNAPDAPASSHGPELGPK
jgi:integrase